jgi:outer membrane protein TolC
MTSKFTSLYINIPMISQRLILSVLLIVFYTEATVAQSPMAAPPSSSIANPSTNLATSAFSLEKLLNLALQEAVEIKSIELEIKSLDAEISARDLALATTIELNADSLNDNRESTATTPIISSKTYDLTLTMPFSTGTSITAATDLTEATLDNTAPDERNTAAWSIGIKQNLWRDFLGHGSRLRRKFDNAEQKARKYELLLKKQNLLVLIESAYWDLVAATKELEIRKENLKKSEQISAWVRGRVSRSAASRSDILQADALLKSRQLQLRSLENQIESAWLKIQQNLPSLNQRSSWKPELKELEADRDLSSLFYKSKDSGKLMSLQSLAGHFRSTQAQAKADQVADSVRPELIVYANYGANAIDEERATAISDVQDDPNQYSQVGINFKTTLDFGLNSDLKESSRALAEVSKIQAELKKQQSVLEWTDLQREIKSLKEQALIAQELADIQLKKSMEERRDYQQGKATLFQAVAFEVEAAEAELGALQALAVLRKAEAQARLFAKEEI